MAKKQLEQLDTELTVLKHAALDQRIPHRPGRGGMRSASASIALVVSGMVLGWPFLVFQNVQRFL